MGIIKNWRDGKFSSKQAKNAEISASQSFAELAMLSRSSSQKEHNFIENRVGVPIYKFSDYESYLSTGYKRVWATFRACRLISSVLMGARYTLTSERYEDILPEDLNFLEAPNEYDSWTELIEMYCFHMELTGNAYWLKDDLDVLGRPRAIYPLLPQYVKVIPDRNKKIAKYIYHVNGQEIPFLPEQIIHFKSTHPSSLVMGMGSIEPSQELYQNFIMKNKLEEKFIERGATLSGILTRKVDKTEDMIDPEDWEALKVKWKQEYEGKGNIGKTAFLNGDWNYVQLGMTMAEMQSLEKEKWTVHQIFLNHGIPLSLAGIENSANYATANQDEINFRKYKCIPLITLLVDKLNSDGFIQGGDPTAKLSFTMDGLIDTERVMKDMGEGFDRGAFNRNDIREALGKERITDDPDMDAFYLDGKYVPAELAGFGSRSDV